MELKNSLALYICAAVAVVYLILAFISFRRKRKYKDGSKAFEPDYLKEIPFYRRQKIYYAILKVVLSLTVIVSIVMAGFLASRPYETRVTEVERHNRDIMLVMDISMTVDELNAILVDKLKATVEDLEGERVGIVIFNTSPVLLCPLTTDYQYVLDNLDLVKEALELRTQYYEGDFWNMDIDRFNYLDEYISSGTLYGNEERGSSIIGDGLASGALNFPDLEEDPDRTRIILFSTDNDLAGEELITLPQAAQMCEDRGIIVYGIGTEIMGSADRAMMKNAVESTGGEFYYGENENTMTTIIRNINKQTASLVGVDKEISEVEQPEMPFILLLISVSAMMVLAKVCRV